MSPRILGHDPAEVAARWQAEAAQLAAGHAPRLPDPTPPAELLRTPAAARVAALATASGLGSFHFERRVHLPLPAAWVPPGHEDLAEPPTWTRGVLPEQKYQSFRHDLALASFHPHHRAKWNAHELCHGLVGFAWAPDATPLFHATAGRLAELLPVALWYFFDEAFLVRCPDHLGQGALFRVHCAACERLAAPRPHDPDAVARIAAGLRYVEGELAAIARSRREGRPIPHRHATLDLSSDGVAYALAHGRRLESPAFHRFAERFLVPGGGWSPDLDALEARVLEVLGGLLAGPSAPLAPSPAHGRWRWILQDVGWRLLHLAVEAAPRTRHRLTSLADNLADAVTATTSPAADPERAAVTALMALHEALQTAGAGTPPVEEVLGVGYSLPGVPTAIAPLREGLLEALPLTTAVLEEHLDPVVTAFTVADDWTRRPLAERFVGWLEAHHPGPLVDLARWEAALAGLPDARPPELSGPPAGPERRLAAGVRVLRLGHDPLDLAARAEEGAVRAAFVQGRLGLEPLDDRPLTRADTGLVLAREPDGELLVLDVDPDAAEALRALQDQPGVPALPDDERNDLEAFGVLQPLALAERAPARPL